MKHHFFLFFSSIILFAACSKKEIKPSFKTLENVSFQRIDGNIQINADVVMHNPNPVGITIQGSEFDLELNQKAIGTVVQRNPFQAEAKSDFKIPVTYIFEPDNIVKSLLLGGLGMLTSKEADFLISGNVEVKVIKQKFSIPINTTKKVSLK